MRSEERAGIVFLIMLFLWGTPVAEPFHIFVRYINKIINFIALKAGIPPVVCAALTCFLLILLTFILQKVSLLSIGDYIPVAIAAGSLVLFIVRTVVKSEVKVNDAVALIVPVAVIMLVYLLRLGKPLVWITDFYVYSIPVALTAATLFVPLSSLNGTLAGLLYITRYNELDIVGPFAGLLGVPGIVWGVFFTVVAALPIVFSATGGRKA